MLCQRLVVLWRRRRRNHRCVFNRTSRQTAQRWAHGRPERGGGEGETGAFAPLRNSDRPIHFRYFCFFKLYLFDDFWLGFIILCTRTISTGAHERVIIIYTYTGTITTAVLVILDAAYVAARGRSSSIYRNIVVTNSIIFTNTICVHAIMQVQAAHRVDISVRDNVLPRLIRLRTSDVN